MEKIEERSEHILVCLSSAPSNAKIIRTAATMAHAFACDFTALFVRTPDHSVMEKADQDRLRENIALAELLGATVETVFGDDVSYQIAEYARLSGVTKIVIGRSAIKRRHLFGKPTLTEKLTTIVPDLDIHIIPDAATGAAYRPRKAKKRLDIRVLIRDILISLGILTVSTVIGYGFMQSGFTEANIITIYLLGALFTAMITTSRSSYVLSAVASVLVFNFFFTEPQFSLKAYDKGYPLTFLVMLFAALVVGSLTDRMKSHVKQSTQAAYRTNLLFETNRLLQQAATDEEIVQAAKIQISKLVSRGVTIYDSGASLNEKEIGYPIRINDQVYGSIGIDADGGPLDAFENSILLSILGECALALESSRNAREKEEAKRQAENEKLRATLLRAISHDLRTPLTSISGNAGILMEDGDEVDAETKKQIYRDIYDDSTWLINLVENLLAITRIDDGRMKLMIQPQLVEEIVSEALQHIRRKRVDQRITVDHRDELLMAVCDARLIVQVLINLVDNAIKYTPTQSHIEVCTRKLGKMVEFTVSDDGEGIGDEEKGKIFQMFYTGSNPIADSRRSLGLGLSLCKSIVLAHGGEIAVQDNHPKGTIFTFTLPAGEVEVRE